MQCESSKVIIGKLFVIPINGLFFIFNLFI